MAFTKLNRKQANTLRPGFTLVEMLVSVTLVLLMMTMFTSIFQMATNSVTVQRGIAENDQAARSFTTALRADFAKRSMRFGQPYYPTEFEATSPTPFGDRAGYLYVSANDMNSWQDDLLQFTVNVSQSQEESDDTRYFGAAELLYDLAADPAFGNTPRATTLRFNPNQPDADDANLSANQVTSSSAAEISYFVRNGGLYRRVMLLREPLPVAGEELAIQPTSTIGGNAYVQSGVFTYVGTPLNIQQTDSGDTNHFALATGDSAPPDWKVTATNDLWRHFDISAVPIMPATAPFLPLNASFVGIDALDNSLLGSATVLGNPAFRFGFNRVTGFSREHDNATNLLFIGRFVQAETSHPDFNYPLAASRIEPDADSAGDGTVDFGNIDISNFNQGTNFLGGGNGNPMDLAGTSLNLDQKTGVISQLAGATGRGGIRRVEDLLLSNVHGMKVEIWDSRLKRYVSPSHGSRTQLANATGLPESYGDYHFLRNLNLRYGPHGPRGLALASANNHVFDTWNPNTWVDYDGDSVRDLNEVSPPFIPYRYYPPRQNDGTVPTGGSYSAACGPGPSPTGMPSPYNEFDPETGLNQKNKGYWVPSDFSDIDPTNWIYHNYTVGDVVFAPIVDNAPVGTFDWDIDTIPSQGFQIAFVCVQDGYAGSAPPAFPSVAGQRFSDRQDALAAGTPAVWRSIDNRRPLRSIRVTVQFYDQKTEKLRQLALVLPVTTER